MSQLLSFLVLSIAAASAWAKDDVVANLIRQGLDVYAEAQALTERNARVAAFRHAEQLFTDATLRGVANADVYTNAGTAALQAERLGPAVLAFKRALVLDPDHGTARRNLNHARTLLPAWVPKPSSGRIRSRWWARACSS